jgi:hypothetical protein
MFVVHLQVLAHEPALQLVGADHLADDEIVAAVVTALRCFARQRPCFLQDDLVRVDQAAQLIRDTLAPARRTRNARFLHYVVRQGHAMRLHHGICLRPTAREPSMPQVRVDAYEVLYSANSFSPRIALKNAGNYIGQLLFLPNGSTLPADTVVNKQAQLHYHLDDFRNVVDLLRNEKPIYMYYNGSGSGFENGIRTMSERVGEGEIIQD